MGPTRFPYGQALGFANQFRNVAGGTAGLLAEGDATPDVTTGSLFYTANTSSTTITHFDLSSYAERAPNYEGKVITVFFIDNSTRLANAGRLFLSSTNDLVGSQNVVTLMHSRSGWYEMYRSYNNTTEVQSYSVGPASSLNVDGTKVALVLNTGSVTKFISAFSGGQQGQIVTLLNAGSNAVVVQTGGNIRLVGTNAYVVNASGAYQFVMFNSAFWRMITVGTLGNA